MALLAFLIARLDREREAQHRVERDGYQASLAMLRDIGRAPDASRARIATLERAIQLRREQAVLREQAVAATERQAASALLVLCLLSALAAVGWIVSPVLRGTASLRPARFPGDGIALPPQPARSEAGPDPELGQLTGGIAHDFNNILSVVVGGLDLARRHVDANDDELARHIDRAMDGANRAALMTRQLLSFSQLEPLLPETVDPAALLAAVACKFDDPSQGLRVESRVGPWVGHLWTDRRQAELAICNLAANARDAINGPGRIVIAAENVSISQGVVGRAPAGQYVRLSVSDTGEGIATELLDRVIEPFFTTHAPKQGAGLGLSQVHGFARRSGGEMMIDSRPGRGTTVSIYLPRAAARAMPTPVPVETKPVMVGPGIGRSILLVDDDPRVAAGTLEMLAELGHHPVGCESGEAALALLARRPDIELVISDVLMPGMTGPELIAKVRVAHPEAAVLFVSGFIGENALAKDFTGHTLLRKPFTLFALEQALAAAFRQQLSALPRGAAIAAAR